MFAEGFAGLPLAQRSTVHDVNRQSPQIKTLRKSKSVYRDFRQMLSPSIRKQPSGSPPRLISALDVVIKVCQEVDAIVYTVGIRKIVHFSSQGVTPFRKDRVLVLSGKYCLFFLSAWSCSRSFEYKCIRARVYTQRKLKEVIRWVP